MPTNSLTQKLRSIQALRAFAALAVLLYHIGLQQEKYGHEPFLGHFKGALGVDMFFVISGFIMMYVSRKVEPSWLSARIFLYKRVVRIVPIYWFYTGLMAFLLLFFASLFDNAEFNAGEVVSSFLFIPHAEGAITGVGWTLNYEMYFYVLFAFSIPISYAMRSTCLSFFLITSVALGLLFSDSGDVFFEFYTRPLLIEFLLGVFVYGFTQSSFRLPKSALWSGIVLASVFMGATMTMDLKSFLIPYRLFVWGVPSAVILYAVVMLEAQGLSVHKIFVSLGDASYSLYLSHIFVLPLVGKIVNIFARDVAFLGSTVFKDILFISGCLLLSLITAYASYYLLEKPSHQLILKKLKL